MNSGNAKKNLDKEGKHQKDNRKLVRSFRKIITPPKIEPWFNKPRGLCLFFAHRCLPGPERDLTDLTQTILQRRIPPAKVHLVGEMVCVYVDNDTFPQKSEVVHIHVNRNGSQLDKKAQTYSNRRENREQSRALPS